VAKTEPNGNQSKATKDQKTYEALKKQFGDKGQKGGGKKK
jgi:hypothetical protein